MARVRVTWCGTSSGIPTLERGVSCTVLRLEKQAWVVDVGEGSQVQLLRAKVPFGRIERVFITHLHGDHCYGLPGLISMRQMKGTKTPLHVYGPSGIKLWLDTTFAMNGSFFGFDLVVHELDTEVHHHDLGDLRTEAGHVWHVSAHALQHRVPCFGYVFREPLRVVPFDAKAAMALGVPRGPLLGQLARGDPVRVPAAAADGAAAAADGDDGDGDGDGDDDGEDVGRLITRDMCRGGDIPGRVITLLGDTCDSSAIAEAAQGSDVISHECTFANDMLDRSRATGHSTAGMAGAFARAIGAKRLVLTHFSARYGDKGSEVTIDTLAEQAREAAGDGVEVMTASDAFTVEVPQRRSLG